jgi:hypothetical protein
MKLGTFCPLEKNWHILTPIDALDSLAWFGREGVGRGREGVGRGWEWVGRDEKQVNHFLALDTLDAPDALDD